MEPGGEVGTKELYPGTADPSLCSRSETRPQHAARRAFPAAMPSPAAGSIAAPCREQGTSTMAAEASGLCVQFRAGFLQFFEQPAFGLSDRLVGDLVPGSSASPWH